MEEAWEAGERHAPGPRVPGAGSSRAVRLVLRPLRHAVPNRVNQLEAAALDGELIDMLLDQVGSCLCAGAPRAGGLRARRRSAWQ